MLPHDAESDKELTTISRSLSWLTKFAHSLNLIQLKYD